jgi:hypothetical protein
MTEKKMSLWVKGATHESIRRAMVNLRLKSIQEATERALEIGLKAMAAKARKRRPRWPSLKEKQQ